MRKRLAKNRWIQECGLKYTYIHMNRIVYKPPGASKAIRLGGINDSRKSVIQRYDSVVNGDKGTLDWLLNTYIADRQKAMRGKQPASEKTIEGYQNYKRVMLKKEWFGKFGNPTLGQIRRTSIRSYLDNYPGYTQARLHIQFLRAAWNWISETHDLPPNPCAGISMPPAPARKQYWSIEQHNAALDVAFGMREPYMFAVMELQYLQGARHSEVLNLRVSDCNDQGIILTRSKGSKDELTLWTPRLRAVYEFCRQLNPSAPAPIDGSYLIHNRDGSRITESQYKNACRRIKAKCLAIGFDLSDLHFHDLKANAAMDRSDGDVGHLTPAMQRRYAERKNEPKARKATR